MISSLTKRFGIVGHPVGHSLSPIMHNAAMKAVGFDGIYLAFDVIDIGRALTAAATLGFSGLSVTIPHKESILEYLGETDPLAREIGAVNTAVYLEDRRYWKGYNSDGEGALRAIQRALPDTTRIRNIALLGSGGAARAVGYTVARSFPDTSIHIIARNPHTGNQLAASLNRKYDGRISYVNPADVTIDQWKSFNLIINATPVGMFPKTDTMPIDAAALQGQTVFDTVYNPRDTMLLRNARKRGCRVINGLDMLLYQGVFQFEKFTGQPAPVDTMRKTLENALKDFENPTPK